MGKNRLGASQSTFLSFRNDLRNMHVSLGLNLRDRNELDVTKEKGGLKIIEEKFGAVSSLISDYLRKPPSFLRFHFRFSFSITMVSWGNLGPGTSF